MLTRGLQSLLLVSGVSAHFILQYPPSLGFDDDTEGTSPCGGFDVTFNDSDASIPVGGFPILVESTHPEADWLFRVTTDTEAPFNWTNLENVVSETGLGEFCIPDFVAPSSFAGSKGLIQVIQNGDDGILYQCAAVNFVTGTNTSVASSCANATGLSATVTTETDFNSTSTATTTSSTASSTTDSLAALNSIPTVWMSFGVGLAAILALA